MSSIFYLYYSLDEVCVMPILVCDTAWPLSADSLLRNSSYLRTLSKGVFFHVFTCYCNLLISSFNPIFSYCKASNYLILFWYLEPTNGKSTEIISSFIWSRRTSICLSLCSFVTRKDRSRESLTLSSYSSFMNKINIHQYYHLILISWFYKCTSISNQKLMERSKSLLFNFKTYNPVFHKYTLLHIMCKEYFHLNLTND